MKKHTNLLNEVYVGKPPKTDWLTIAAVALMISLCFLIFIGNEVARIV